MGTLEHKISEQRYAWFDDLFAGMPLPVTEPKPKSQDVATAKPSDLIDLAIDDLEATEKIKGYRINMQQWHRPKFMRACEVCLAGSVMARRLGVARRDSVDPGDWDFPIRSALQSLDAFRCGDIEDAFHILGYGPPANYGLPETVEHGEYHDNPAGFKADMRALAQALREAGL